MLKINYEHKNYKDTPTIVFLHGWGLSGSFFDGIESKLNSDVSVLKIDLPGFGLSEMPLEYFDTYEYAYQVFLLLNRLRVDNVILVGHSFGGRLSILLSSIYNINICGMILTSSAGLNRFNLIKYLKIKIYKFAKKNLRKGNAGKLILRKFASVDYLRADGNLRNVFVRVVNQDLRNFAKMIKSIPVMLVWDRRDKETRFWICKKLHKLINGSKVILFRGGGHFVAFKNQYKFASVIRDILNIY